MLPLLRQHQKFQETLQAYTNCLDCFQLAIKWEKHATAKEQYQERLLEYLERAEKIKEILAQQVKEKKQILEQPVHNEEELLYELERRLGGDVARSRYAV